MEPGMEKAARDALDWLRDRLLFIYENMAGEYLKNPWKARDDYIDIILDRSQENIKKLSFLSYSNCRDMLC